jgi:hypothetical protein
MTGGYRVYPDELTAFAGRLDESAEEVRVVAASVREPLGDLGPEGVTRATELLMAEWARALLGVELDAVADGLRAVAETYRRADEFPSG